jgi:hypothetical protein
MKWNKRVNHQISPRLSRALPNRPLKLWMFQKDPWNSVNLTIENWSSSPLSCYQAPKNPKNTISEVTFRSGFFFSKKFRFRNVTSEMVFLEPRFRNSSIFLLLKSVFLEPRFRNGVFESYIPKLTNFGS